MDTTTPLLALDDVTVSVDDTIVCRDITLTVNHGENHVLIGANGSGKSSLLNAIMGTGPFQVTRGRILLNGQDITELSVDERARAGLGLAVQHPPKLHGITVSKLAQAIHAGDRLPRLAEELNLSDFLDRDVHCGFSGGEMRRFEMLKLRLQQPTMCLLDEPESGVDMEHVSVVGRALADLLQTPCPDGTARSSLVVTHTGFILDHLDSPIAHLMSGGRLTDSGDARDMLARVRTDGWAA
ncbi:ATP-binding cassette domain-containing protein [Corynebacterium sp. CCM 9185]|uniref:ATP-binding cassette domain-containing protein n=1 Tax=Corynebacterium marambiense TaxID=2765364 RepID=A0ABS0VUL4_9CORY|nr:ATP-binding cassette domain-containing protein [Corynebacterium marambiense]MBI9000448.1 ATP-binding cassette domain-containing protein [Corynebacterium marambiense]MCK7664201.1 ATP-binding cassette domain-containing protein [Corynebacterium marambiense]MCX7543491.1 ATP-binding cassette domain-containing protein [Corynebacterium marambiense]